MSFVSFSQMIYQKQSLRKPSNSYRYLFGYGSKLQTWKMKRLPKKGFIEKVSVLGLLVGSLFVECRCALKRLIFKDSFCIREYKSHD